MDKKVEEMTDELFKAFNAPSKKRLFFIKLIFPEIVKVAEKLKEVYWDQEVESDLKCTCGTYTGPFVPPCPIHGVGEGHRIS